MKNTVTEAEIEQFARYSQSVDEARGWPAKGRAFYLARGRYHFGEGGTMPSAAVAFGLPTPTAPKPPPQPVKAAVAPVPVIPAAVVADRARMAAIVEAAPPGADAEAAEAIRTGASVEEFRRSLGAFTILSAMQAARS